MARLSMELVAETAGLSIGTDVWVDVESLKLNFATPEVQRRYQEALSKITR